MLEDCILCFVALTRARIYKYCLLALQYYTMHPGDTHCSGQHLRLDWATKYPKIRVPLKVQVVTVSKIHT